MRRLADDQGTTIELGEVRRVVSLVPSLTEAVAVSAPGVLVGATEWCTHPRGLDVPRFGGTKNPDLAGVVAAAPDLVVVNEEENKPEHVAALRAAGVPVWVTDIRSVAGALASLARLLEAIEAPERAWLVRAEQAWAEVPEPAMRRRGLVPIWRRPWMAVGADTYAGDVLRRLGIDNVLADSDERYPRFDADSLVVEQTVDVVVLPDEPYRFTTGDGPEAFDVPSVLVPGRPLTWYGPAMVEAPAVLGALLAPPRA